MSKKTFQVIASEGVSRESVLDADRKARQKRIVLGTPSTFSMRTAGHDSIDSAFGSIYSPQLSTDFLELPQNLREKHQWFRHFVRNDEIVGRAIEIHTDQPISKVRLAPPKCKDPQKPAYILDFFERMCDRLKLTKVLLDGAYEYNVFGNSWAFMEDQSRDEYEIPTGGRSTSRFVSQQDQYSVLEPGDTGKELKYKYDKNVKYKGWNKIIILPPDAIKIKTYDFTDRKIIELIPSEETKKMVSHPSGFDPEYQKVMEDIPDEIKKCILEGKNIPLSTDPDSGSFVYHLKGRSSYYEPLGYSRLDRCLRSLLYWDKLRQAQTQIASRAMTPKRLVSAENLSEPDTIALREQVDMALVDPDYSIVTNFPVTWENIGANDRLLQISQEWDHVFERLLAGLGITRDLLTGEGSYTGSRVSLEVMNQQYMRFREIFREFVEDAIFKPVARKKGFYEKDEFGNQILLIPRLEFTRLSIRDNQDTYDQLFTLYQKGSLPLEVILEHLNISPEACRKALVRDLGTVDDASINDAIRAAYQVIGQRLADQTDLFEKIVAGLDLEYVPPEAEQTPQEITDPQAGRF